MLVDLITHQDSITWTSLSVFLAAEFILVSLLLPALISGSTTIGTISAMGLLVTLVSFLLLRRSSAYLDKYFRLAQDRCHPDDLAIFNVRAEALPARWVLTFFHGGLGVFWGVIIAAYFAVTHFGYRP